MGITSEPSSSGTRLCWVLPLQPHLEPAGPPLCVFGVLGMPKGLRVLVSVPLPAGTDSLGRVVTLLAITGFPLFVRIKEAEPLLG